MTSPLRAHQSLLLRFQFPPPHSGSRCGLSIRFRQFNKNWPCLAFTRLARVNPAPLGTTPHIEATGPRGRLRKRGASSHASLARGYRTPCPSVRQVSSKRSADTRNDKPSLGVQPDKQDDRLPVRCERDCCNKRLCNHHFYNWPAKESRRAALGRHVERAKNYPMFVTYALVSLPIVPTACSRAEGVAKCNSNVCKNVRNYENSCGGVFCVWRLSLSA